MQVDLSEAEIPDNITIHKDETKWNFFELHIIPTQGYWAGFKYEFTFEIPSIYPYKPPK